MSNIGIMDGAYFVGRNELLNWLNSTLSLGLTKIEQTASGAVACQLMDLLHPGSINIAKVDFNGNSEYEYINNYKVLQTALNKLEIDRFVDVNKLVKGRPLDNMEFMQWFKSYFDSQIKGRDVDDYDAQARRAQSKTGDFKTPGMSIATSGPKPVSASKSPGTTKVMNITASASTKKPASSITKATTTYKKPLVPSRTSTPKQEHDRTPPELLSQYELQLEELTIQVGDLQGQVENAERERDFYFDKLRDIEILCQLPELKDEKILKSIEKILYATDPAEAKDTIVAVQLQYANALLSEARQHYGV